MLYALYYFIQHTYVLYLYRCFKLKYSNVCIIIYVIKVEQVIIFYGKLLRKLLKITNFNITIIYSYCCLWL